METLSDKLNHYMDAGFPILYLETFEEEKADRLIAQVARNQNFSVVESNTRGLFFTTTAERMKNDLSTALINFIEPPPMAKEKFDLNRKILVIKDATKKLEQSDVAGKLKYLAELITAGELDARIIIVSSLVVLPKEIEHLITLLSMDYPTEPEIFALIKNFCEQTGLPTPQRDLLQRMVDAFKKLETISGSQTENLREHDSGRKIRRRQPKERFNRGLAGLRKIVKRQGGGVPVPNSADSTGHGAAYGKISRRVGGKFAAGNQTGGRNRAVYIVA